MESPLPYDDQDDKLKSQFDRILSAINSINRNSFEEEIRALNDRIQREVTTKPVLAKIVQQQRNISLLNACITSRCEQFHPAIKCLIEANPSALLWPSNTSERTIRKIAGHPSHCVLMPWIATNYQWVLDHDMCLVNPPVFYLLARYANRGETGCTAEIIRQFFEIYPRGLTQVNNNRRTPLHALLMGSAECEADLFKWMVEQCPSNMLKRNIVGDTPLHCACYSLTRYLEDDSSEICKYLIEQCPKSVRIPDDVEGLPIHNLLDVWQHPLVKEVVVCLLRAYPESYNMQLATSRDHIPSPSSIPFIQGIKRLLDEEREIKENVAYLQDVAGVFRDAVDGTPTPSQLAGSTCNTFVNWAKSFTRDLEAEMEQISMQLEP